MVPDVRMVVLVVLADWALVQFVPVVTEMRHQYVAADSVELVQAVPVTPDAVALNPDVEDVLDR